jgi:putative hydrolase of the HAD superfamily
MKKKIKDRVIKGVFFDAGGTLFEVKGGVGHQYSRIAGKYGVQVAPVVLDDRFKEVFEITLPPAFPGTDDHERANLEHCWWKKVVRNVFDGIPFPDFDLFFNEVYLLFSGSEGWVLFPETIGVLKDLHARSLYIGMISNFDSRLGAICQSLNISCYFSGMIFSSRHGVAKPSPKIFASALKEAGLSPSESIYIGDSIHHDIKGALSIGMKPLLVDRADDHRDREDIDRISSLSGVFRYI